MFVCVCTINLSKCVRTYNNIYTYIKVHIHLYIDICTSIYINLYICVHVNLYM